MGCKDWSVDDSTLDPDGASMLEGVFDARML